jgi:heme A synthase
MDTDRMQVATVPLVLLLLLVVALLLGTSKLRLHHPAEQVLMDMGLIPVMAQLCLVWAPRVLLRV